jgi:disulfide bond formation protein DsbB
MAEESKSLRIDRSEGRLKPLFATIAFLSAFCLVFSFGAEFGYNLKPCRLCLVQRYIYEALLLSGILGFVLRFKALVLKIVMLMLCIGFFISAYHSLTHFGLVKAKCSSSIYKASDELSFMKSLTDSPACSDNTLTIFGIPAPVANAGIYLACWACLNKRKIQAKRVQSFKDSTNCDSEFDN